MTISGEWLCISSVRWAICKESDIPTIILCDLVTRRLILVEVVFSVEAASVLDLAIQRESCAQSREERFFLEVRLRAGECGIEECYMAIWRVIGRRRSTREEFPRRIELSVYLNADCEPPFL